MVKEACVENLETALVAERQGADQVELCGRLDLDGITPDLDLVQKVLAQLHIHLKVMVRPRGGDFVYNEAEIEEMTTSIESFKRLGVKEVVLGILTGQNQIDIEKTKKLAAFAQPMKVTFHKAIDELDDPVDGAKQLMEVPGITGVLTSGGKSTAEEGTMVIKKMIDVSKGKLQIIAAGKVTNNNLEEIHGLIGAGAYHGKLIVGQLS